MKAKELSDITVIDLTQNVAGGYCTKLLAGFGARVIRVDPPEADGAGGKGTLFSDVENGETKGISYLWLNTGKKSITLDIENTRGREILKKLLQQADVLVETLPMETAKKCDLEYEAVSAINQGIVQISISNFGRSGPYGNFEAEEIQFQAMSGMMHLTGDRAKAPLAAGPSICMFTAGLHAYTATLMALFRRNVSGAGQHVEVSIHESSMENVEIGLAQHLQQQTNPVRGPHPGVPWATYACRDGYCVIISMPARHWHKAREIFDDPVLFEERYDHILGRIKDRQEYEGRISRCAKKLTRQELFFQGQERNLAFGYVAGLREGLELVQHQERGFYVEQDHPWTGGHTICGAPFKLPETPWQSERAPLPGEHNHEIYCGVLGCTGEEITTYRHEGII